MKNLRIFICLLMLQSIASQAFAQQDLESLRPYLSPQKVQRYALVISVEKYNIDIGKVDNATNDAILVGNALAQADFQVTPLSEPEDSAAIIAAVEDIARLANPSSGPAVIAIFFAGHGFQLDGFNYIVPRGAKRSSLRTDSLALSTLLGLVAPAEAGISVIILDACRSPTQFLGDNSFGFSRTDSKKNSVIGMAAESRRAAASSFATGTGASKNSPYSAALGAHIPNVSHTLASFWDSVRDDVQAYTNGDQSPEEIVSVSQSRFRFVVRNDALETEAKEWERLISSKPLRYGCISRFIRAFPGGLYNKAAIILRESLGSAGDYACAD